MGNSLIKTRKLSLIISIALFVLSLGLSLVCTLLGYSKNYWVNILVVSLIGLTTAYLSYAITALHNVKETIASIRRINNYRFGENFVFYDFKLFTLALKRMRRHHHKRDEAHLIAFTAIPSKDTQINNAANKALNSKIALFLHNLLTDRKDINKNDFAYCYYSDSFIIFAYRDIRDTSSLIEAINKAIYDIVNENELKVYVQPHYGIRPVDESKDIVALLDDVLLTKDVAERNFEQVAIYKDSFRDSTNEKDIQELRDAIRKKELVVYYQPKYDLKKKAFIGSEALVRWDSPKYGLLSPAKFIQKAELGGLIHEIDLYVFRKVIADLEEQKARKMRLLPVSVNFSLYEFYSPSFLNDIEKYINDSTLDPRLIEIEITETTSQANTFMATSILNRLRAIGLKILMDDFGTGFSNISHLNTLPIDVVKIDKSFIDGITGDKKNKEVVKFLINLCKANQISVIAEGVDSNIKVEILESLGCDAIQGYYYSAPLPKDEYEKFLKDNPFEKKGEKKR